MQVVSGLLKVKSRRPIRQTQLSNSQRRSTRGVRPSHVKISKLPKNFLAPEEHALAAAIRQRLQGARLDVTKLPLQGLPLQESAGLDCNFLKHMDVPARRISTHAFDGKTPAGEDFKFVIHTLGRFQRKDGTIKLWEIVELKGGYYPPHNHEKCSARFLFMKGKGAAFERNAWSRFNYRSIKGAPVGAVHAFVADGRSFFISVQTDRPIACLPSRNGVQHVDFYSKPDPEFPDWVAQLRKKATSALPAPQQ